MEKATRKKIIVLGAHPDDPETASGGMMALLAQAGHNEQENARRKPI